MALICLSLTADKKQCDHEKVITQSQLEFDTRVLLIRAGGVGAAFAPIDEGLLRHGLEGVVGQLLETAEADKLSAFPVDDEDIEKEMKAFQDRLGGQPQLERFLKAYEADGSTLAAVLARSLRTQRVLDAKVKLKAAVSEAEARRWQDSHPDYRSLPLSSVREKLFRERYDELVAQELKQIRKDAKVRLLGAFAPQTSAEAK